MVLLSINNTLIKFYSQVYNYEQQKLYDIFDKEIDIEEGSLDTGEPTNEKEEMAQKENIPAAKKLSAIDIIKSGAGQVPRYYKAEKRYDAEGNEKIMKDYVNDHDSDFDFASLHDSDLETTSSEPGDERDEEKGFCERTTIAVGETDTSSEEGETNKEHLIQIDQVEDDLNETMTDSKNSEAKQEIQEDFTCITTNKKNLIFGDKIDCEISGDIFEEFTINQERNNECETMTDATVKCDYAKDQPIRPRKLAINSDAFSNIKNENPTENLHNPISTEHDSLCSPEVVFRDQGSDINNLMNLMNQSENLLVENQQRGKSFLDMLLGEVTDMEKDPEFRQEVESIHKIMGSDLEKPIEKMNSTARKGTGKLHSERNEGVDIMQNNDSTEHTGIPEIEHDKTLDSQIGKGLKIHEICSIANDDDVNSKSQKTENMEISQEQAAPIIEIIGETSIQRMERLDDESQEDEIRYLATIFGGKHKEQAGTPTTSLLLSETIQRLTETSDSESDSEAPKLCRLSQEKQENLRFRPLIEEMETSQSGKTAIHWNASSSSSFDSTTEQEVRLKNKEEMLSRKLVNELPSNDKQETNFSADCLTKRAHSDMSIKSAHIYVEVPPIVEELTDAGNKTPTEFEELTNPADSEVKQEPQSLDTGKAKDYEIHEHKWITNQNEVKAMIDQQKPDGHLDDLPKGDVKLYHSVTNDYKTITDGKDEKFGQDEVFGEHPTVLVSTNGEDLQCECSDNEKPQYDNQHLNQPRTDKPPQELNNDVTMSDSDFPIDQVSTLSETDETFQAMNDSTYVPLTQNAKRIPLDMGAGDASKAIWSRENEYFTVERYNPVPSIGLQNAIPGIQDEDTSKT